MIGGQRAAVDVECIAELLFRLFELASAVQQHAEVHQVITHGRMGIAPCFAAQCHHVAHHLFGLRDLALAL